MDNPTKKEKQLRRHKRVRSKVVGTTVRPRLCVFRSNRYIYGQLIDDEAGRTLAASSDRRAKGTKAKSRTESRFDRGSSTSSGLRSGTGEKIKEVLRGISAAHEAGKRIAQKAKEMKITKVVFDRGGYKYHGQVKAFAEGAREGGLLF